MTTQEAESLAARLSTIEHEAARVAIAFGVERWEEKLIATQFQCLGFGGELPVAWHLNSETARFSHVSIGTIPETSLLYKWHERMPWKFVPGKFDQLMARGLFRLGFEDVVILAQLPQLSEHEKMEARLSMPREFWPEKWVEEAEKGEGTITKPLHSQ